MTKKNILALVVFIVLAVASIFIYKKKNGSTLADEPLADFAIADTATITKIFLTDNQGNSALVERVPGERLWNLNKKYKARKDGVDLVLETINRIRVRGAVSKTSRDNMMKILATGGKKVEIYQGGDEPTKIYYVGPSTPDHMGTIMLLEIPGEGRSEEPYITHMEGFTGFLTPRFFTSEMEWRYTGYYSYPELNFTEVQVIDNYAPQNSVKVEYLGGNNISLFTNYQPALESYNTQVSDFDSLLVKDLLLLFKKVHFDSYNTLLRPEAMDSMDKVIPAYTLRVKEKSGNYKDLRLYNKRAAVEKYDEEGNLKPWDLDYFWAKTESGEYALAQKFVFGPIVVPISYYLKRNV